MSAAQQEAVPPWSLGWRLQRALAWAEIPVQAIADELGVSRTTVSRWLHDVGARPRTIYLRAWSARCRVPYEWLAYGDELPRVDSNHQPAGWGKDLGNVPIDHHSRAREILAFRKRLPTAITRPGLAQSGDHASADLPTCQHR